MELCYRINDGIIYRPPIHWDTKINNNLITISIYDYDFLIAINVYNNIYIGYYNEDKYTIYFNN